MRIGRQQRRVVASPGVAVEVSHLRVEGAEPVFLVHEEHDRLVVPAGVYEVRRQREYAPSGRSRRVSD